MVDNKDPDKLARVKVKYPSLTQDETSWWAPLVAFGAGKDLVFEMWFQEVIVRLQDQISVPHDYHTVNFIFVLSHGVKKLCQYP